MFIALRGCHVPRTPRVAAGHTQRPTSLRFKHGPTSKPASKTHLGLKAARGFFFSLGAGVYKDLRNTPEPHRATPCPSPRALPMGQHPAAARSWRQVRRAEGWLQKVAHAKPRAAQGGPMLGARPPVLHFALLGCAQKHPGRQPDTHRGPPRPASKTGPLQKPLQELRCKQLLLGAKARFSLFVGPSTGLGT